MNIRKAQLFESFRIKQNMVGLNDLLLPPKLPLKPPPKLIKLTTTQATTQVTAQATVQDTDQDTTKLPSKIATMKACRRYWCKHQMMRLMLVFLETTLALNSNLGKSPKPSSKLKINL